MERLHWAGDTEEPAFCSACGQEIKSPGMFKVISGQPGQFHLECYDTAALLARLAAAEKVVEAAKFVIEEQDKIMDDVYPTKYRAAWGALAKLRYELAAYEEQNGR